MLRQGAEVRIKLIVALERTADAILPTSLPVLLSGLVFEISVTLFALEGHLLEHLHGKSVSTLRQHQLFAALGAGAFLLLPDHDALLAEQLVALLALFGLLHDLQANSA